MSERVTLSINDGIADVKLTRADKRNALDSAMFIGIAEAGERLKAESGVRAVVLSGDGPSFCAGLDMSSMQAIGDSGDGGAKREDGNPGQMEDGRITHLGQQVCWVWQELPMPVIAAVHGHALGGGLQLALGADIRIAHPDTKMSVREVYWGLVPDMTGTFMLSKLVRPDVARELTYTARIFSGAEAAELGLVTRTSETPYEDAMALAREIAALSPGAVRGSKEVFNALDHDGAAEAFAHERRAIGAQIGTPNQKESVIASFEQRAPVFADG
ncbi:MAG: crotonase/enoyl-CoA hydratase family protein [Ilumatobacter sp.]|uniref:crotonase/enoyl-CoA hydratase family protein n=1 Tax=Ilumatobacter sp. TaxID=1967498 RepID=UPI003C7951EB